jgi:hypothetical protein
MSRRISSFTAGLGALLIAGGVHAAQPSGPVEKGFGRASSERNAKPKPKGKKGADAEEAAEEADDTDKKSKKAKKGKKGKKEEPPPEEEEVEEKPKKKKGKKGKKEEPPPEEEPVDLKDTESPTAAPEEEDELPPEEPPAEPPPAEEPEEGEKAEAAASVSTADMAGKLHIGLRLGYGFMLGSTTGDEPPIEFNGMFPIWLDLGYRFSPSVLLALYGQYGFVSMECLDGASCSANMMRFGLQVQYYFAPAAKIDPWVGLGVGYELANTNIVVTNFPDSPASFKGVDFANLQAGADFKVSPAVGVGPFLSFSFGRYSSGSAEGPAYGLLPGETREGGVSKKSFHEWLVLGLRGSFNL